MHDKARDRPTRLAISTFVLASGVLASMVTQANDVCTVRSAASVPPVVELYTSEGCSSCPPADRWLSQLKGDNGIVALAFHVDYWDRLGWKDRFASPLFTQRQADEQRRNGADFSYTPQVVLDGADYSRWRTGLSALGGRKRAASSIEISLGRNGAGYDAIVRSVEGDAPRELAAFWAVTEDDHTSVVKAGENAGATLRHDYVVREYLPVAAWSASVGPRTLAFMPRTNLDPAHPRHINLVVLDARNGKPVQAVRIGC